MAKKVYDYDLETVEGRAKMVASLKRSVGRSSRAKTPKWCSLLPSDFRGSAPISDREAIAWAIQHVGYKKIEKGDCPSSVAWVYVQLFRSDVSFLKKILDKRVPTVSKVEQDRSFKDDGRKQFNLIEKLKLEDSPGSDSVLSPRTKVNAG